MPSGQPQNLRRGGPGRPRGSRDRVPRTLKASIKRIAADIAGKDPDLIENAIRDGLKAKPPASFQYLQLAAHYLDGKPGETVEHKFPDPVRVTHTFRTS